MADPFIFGFLIEIKNKGPRKRRVYGVCLELKIGLEPTTC
jgi:hypothetical protein